METLTQRGVVPGELGERLGEFLQPAIIGEAAVPDGGIGPERNFQRAAGRTFLPSLRPGRRNPPSAHLPGGQRGVRDQSVVERGLPERLEISARVFSPPVVLHDVVGRAARLAEHHGEDLVRGAPVIKRRDQRLDDAHGAVVSARIAPGFEVMSFRNVPVAELRGLVVLQAEMNSQADLEQAGKQIPNRRARRKPDSHPG